MLNNVIENYLTEFIHYYLLTQVIKIIKTQVIKFTYAYLTTDVLHSL